MYYKCAFLLFSSHLILSHLSIVHTVSKASTTNTMARLSLVASGLLLMAATPCFAQQNVTTTTPVPTEPTTSVPAAPTPQQNQTTTTPTNVTTGAQPTNTSTGGQHGERPSALSQLELTLLGNHSWFDPNKTLQFFQNDYQIINHSPNEICNVTLSAPLVNPESTSVESSYNVKISNSTQMRGIDLLAPFGDTHSIPAGGVMNIGYILMHPLSAAPGNTTAEGNVSPMSGPVTIQSAQ